MRDCNFCTKYTNAKENDSKLVAPAYREYYCTLETQYVDNQNYSYFLTRGPRFELNFCPVCGKKAQIKEAADSGSRAAAFLFVPNVSKRAKCPKCPKTGNLSKMSRNGRNVLNVPKSCAIIMLRVSEISSPETGNTLHFPAGSIARIQELAALNGQTCAVRSKAQRRIEKTESYNPAGVHCGHPLFTCHHSSMEERRLSKAGHRWRHLKNITVHFTTA